MILTMISGQKGGVGKTLFSHIYASWLDRKNIAWCGADTDAANKFFCALHSEKVASVALYGMDGSLDRVAALNLVDAIAQAMESGTVENYVIDMGAGQLDAFLDVFRKTGLFAEVGTNLKLNVVYVITNDKQSVSTLKTNSAAFDNVPGTQWMIVRNHILGPTTGYDDSKHVRPEMIRRGAIEIDMANVHEEDKEMLEKWRSAKVTIDQYADKFASFSRRGILRTWLTSVYTQFDTHESILRVGTPAKLGKVS